MKKFLALLLAAVMVCSLAACTGTTPTTKPSDSETKQAQTSELAGTYDIKVWVAELAVELTKKQIDAFNASNTDGIKFTYTVEPVSEADSATNMITDVTAGGDIYCFAQDQFARLVNAGALAKLGAAAQATVTSANDAGVVSAATAGSEMYAYPLTSDNGYFMYYDKSVISDDIVDDLEKLIEACEKANKYFSFEMQSSAWYLASFFFGAGCVSQWQTDDNGKFVGITDDFNSDKGLIAVKGMQKLVASKIHNSSSKASDFDANSAIVVTGMWDYETAKSILGDNLGVTDLPSFTVDGKSYHLGSFNGCKLLGVKPQTDAKKGAALHKLAQYLTNEECQMERFNELSWGPANKNAQASEAVQSNPGLAALLKQNQYSVPQGQIHDSWWGIGSVIGDEVKAATSEADLKKALQNYEDKISALFSLDTTGYIIVGAWCGWDNSNNDYRMKKDGDVYTFELVVPQADYMGGRIVTPGEWISDFGAAQVTVGKELLAEGSFDTASNGDNNMIFAAPGTYKITFNPSVPEIKIEQ